MFMNPFCGSNALGKQIRWCFNPLSHIYIYIYIYIYFYIGVPCIEYKII